MSLQEYLLGRLLEDPRTPTLEEVLDRAGGRAGGRATLAKAARAVRADRDARWSSSTPVSWSLPWPTTAATVSGPVTGFGANNSRRRT